MSYPSAARRVKMRYVTSLILRYLTLAALLFVTSGAAAQSTLPDEGLSLTLPQARELAAYAIQNDQPELALQIADGLLQADTRDNFAHYVTAVANAQLNRPAESRRAAARAYRFSKPGPDRLRAAELAAQMAYAENRTTLAQLWLRRTAIHTTRDDDEERLARDYQELRRQNPWSFSLRTDVRPSDNVNNGADSAVNTINGIPDSGTIAPRARALSGVIAALDFSTAYRLRLTETNATSVGARLYFSRITLSDSAREDAPDVSGSDFASEYAELSLRHSFAVGPPEDRGWASITGAFGESRYGGERNFRFVRADGLRGWRLSEATTLRATFLAENRFDARSLANESLILSAGIDFARILPSGDRFSLAFALRDTDAEVINGTYRSATLRARYFFAKPVGPAKISIGTSFGRADYPSVVAGIDQNDEFFNAPRDDRTYAADILFFFEDYDYAGFAPTLRLSAERTKSNISLYSSRQLSISLGIQSKF